MVTSVTSRANPDRESATAADRPRSSSIIITLERAQPSPTARSSSAYCNRVDSVRYSTCCRLDWRTCTTASRSRYSGQILFSLWPHARYWASPVTADLPAASMARLVSAPNSRTTAAWTGSGSSGYTGLWGLPIDIRHPP
jgi:hypothetical protein